MRYAVPLAGGERAAYGECWRWTAASGTLQERFPYPAAAPSPAASRPAKRRSRCMRLVREQICKSRTFARRPAEQKPHDGTEASTSRSLLSRSSLDMFSAVIRHTRVSLLHSAPELSMDQTARIFFCFWNCQVQN